MSHTIGDRQGVLDAQDVDDFIESRMAEIDLDGRSLCLVIPDATRTCPLPLLLSAVAEAVGPRVRSCTAVVALGTHAPMTEDAIRSDGRPVRLRRREP